MIDVSKIYEVKTLSKELTAGGSNLECPFVGNDGYGKVLGFGVIVRTSGSDTTDGIKIGLRERGGSARTLLAPTPYEYLKPSDSVAFADKFVALGDVNGHGQDVVFNVELLSAKSANITFEFTVIYSKA